MNKTGEAAASHRSLWHLASMLLSCAGCVFVTTGCSRSTESDLLMARFGNQSPIPLRANGFEYRWHFSLPGPDGQFETADDDLLGDSLLLPPGRPVVLLIESDDYVYTFRQPTLQINQMAIPDIPAEVEFTTPGSGTYPIEFSPMCGFLFLHENYHPAIEIMAKDRKP